MNAMNTGHQDRSRILAKRGGFTLIELLVVFSIIAVLAALIAAGMMTWINSQSRRNTETEIRSIYSALMQHWDAVAADAEKEPNVPQKVIDYADKDLARARVIWIKLRLMEAFPVRFSEIQNFSSYAAPLDMIPTGRRRYQEGFKKLLPPPPPPPPPLPDTTTESAACLLMALSVNHFGVSHPPDMFRPFTRDVNSDGLQEFVDAWGTPLYFYRFTTGNTDLQGTAPPPSNKDRLNYLDPRDPSGKLINNWKKPDGSASANPDDFDKNFHLRLNGSTAWYSVPALVSAGPDTKFGVQYVQNKTSYLREFQDMSPVSANDGLDDIYSFKVK